MNQADHPSNDPLLMIPGPVPVKQDVLDAMSLPLVPHYGAEWTAFYRETISMLRRIQQTDGRLFLLVGSGSAGLDAAIGTATATLPRVLVLKNGFFGERLEEIARSHTHAVSTLAFPPDAAVDTQLLSETLSRQPADLVLVTHCETSTGVLHPIREIAEACRRAGALVLVDAVSSLGIEPLPMDGWEIDVCVSASQKGLGAPPGLATVAVSQAAWERIRVGHARGWYLNLTVWDRYEREWSEWHPHPVTHAVSLVRALNVALQDVLDEGLDARYSRHRDVTASLRSGLRSIGCTPAISDSVASHGVTSVLPLGGNVDALLHCLRDDFSIQIAGGIGDWKGKILRIGHMGPTATQESIALLLSALERAMGMVGDQGNATRKGP